MCEIKNNLVNRSKRLNGAERINGSGWGSAPLLTQIAIEPGKYMRSGKKNIKQMTDTLNLRTISSLKRLNNKNIQINDQLPDVWKEIECKEILREL